MGVPPGPHTVVRIRPATTTDAHGNTTLDYDGGTRTTIEGVWLQQDRRQESFPDGRNPNEQLWLLIGNTLDLGTDDRVEWAGHPTSGTVVFRVHGLPEPTYRLTEAGAHHLEATLRLVDG